MGVVNEPVEDGVGICRVADEGVPFVDRDLTGENGRATPIAFLEDLERSRRAPASSGSRLHGNETRVWGDQAYRGQRAVIRESAPKARDFTNRRYRHRGVVDEIERANNRTKSSQRYLKFPIQPS